MKFAIGRELHGSTVCDPHNKVFILDSEGRMLCEVRISADGQHLVITRHDDEHRGVDSTAPEPISWILRLIRRAK